MAPCLSEAPRIRVVLAVEKGGVAQRRCLAFPRHFGVGMTGAVRWTDGYLRTGRTAPTPRGGDGAQDGSRRTPMC
ncbi:MAG: hypothetical protein AAF354_13755 [Pseudomonadota bacterium]